MGQKSTSGSSKKGRQHVVHAKKCARQWGRTARNKEKAWGKHLSAYPNDNTAKENIKAARKTLRSF